MKLNVTRAWALAVCLVLAVAPTPALAETSAEVREQVEATQVELDELVSQIEEGESKVSDLQSQIDGLAEESIELQTQIIHDKDRLGEIVSTNYKENSDMRPLALLLSSRSVDELISQAYYAQKVSDWEAECIEQLNADKEELDDRIARIQQAKDERSAALAQLEDQRGALEQKVAELNERADQLEEEEREAARRAAEEAARKAAEEQARREAEEKAKREAEEAARKAAEEAARKAAEQQGAAPTAPTNLTGDGWITCIASAYTIADNDPPGSTATASGIPLDESVPTVAMPMSMNPSRFYGSKIEISYNGISVIAMVTDCGYMGGGSRGLDLTPAVFRAFGFSTADSWGLRTVSYRFL